MAASSVRPAPPERTPVVLPNASMLASAQDLSNEPHHVSSEAYDDEEPTTGLRQRFEIDPRAARRALLGAVVLTRRVGGGGQGAGARRVRRRAPSSK